MYCTYFCRVVFLVSLSVLIVLVFAAAQYMLETTMMAESPRSLIHEEDSMSDSDEESQEADTALSSEAISTVIDRQASKESKATTKQGVLFSRSTVSLPIHAKVAAAKKQASSSKVMLCD